MLAKKNFALLIYSRSKMFKENKFSKCFEFLELIKDNYSAISNAVKLDQEPEKMKVWREEQRVRLENKGNSEAILSIWRFFLSYLLIS
jgi:hypothetical protein